MNIVLLLFSVVGACGGAALVGSGVSALLHRNGKPVQPVKTEPAKTDDGKQDLMTMLGKIPGMSESEHTELVAVRGCR
jgi:hypothetical protein